MTENLLLNEEIDMLVKGTYIYTHTLVIRKHICTHDGMDTGRRTYTHQRSVDFCSCSHTLIYTCRHVDTYKYTYTYIHVHIHIYMYTYTYAYTYIYTYTYTYTYIYTYAYP